ncbi:MAG: enoyl-CoA hydratase [Azospirillaceae bacterium]
MTASPKPIEDELRVERGDGIARLTLDRPATRNALSLALMERLDRELAELARDPAIKVVVIAAEGPAFSAGHDLKELRGADRAMLTRIFETCSRLMTRIVDLPRPVIAEVGGMATAAGCQLVASCDLAIASTGARFATPGVNIGLFCSTPMVALSRAVGRKQAMEMLLTGDPVDAETAVALGLVNRAVPAAELRQAVDALATSIAAKSPLTVAIGKEAFYRQIEMPLAEAYRYTAEVMVRNMLARDAAEGIDAFIAKRQPVWSGE